MPYRAPARVGIRRSSQWMASTGSEWLSEQNNNNNARIAGNNACSNFNNNNVNNDNRFRAVFRPWSSLPFAPPVLPQERAGLSSVLPREVAVPLVRRFEVRLQNAEVLFVDMPPQAERIDMLEQAIV